MKNNQAETRRDHDIYIVVKAVMMAVGILLSCFLIGTSLGMSLFEKLTLMVAFVLIFLPLVHKW